MILIGQQRQAGVLDDEYDHSGLRHPPYVLLLLIAGLISMVEGQ